MTDTTARPMRADARRNREALLQAAAELFAEEGTDVSLEAVAARAGVGIGTLYRNFPNRDSLVEAAYRTEVAHLCDAASELLDSNPPDVALAEWMDRFVTYAAAKRGMAGALKAVNAKTDLYSQTRTQITGAIGGLLEAGVEAGTLRADVEPEDVLRATGVVWQLDDQPGWEEQARRLLGLVMDGLRYGASG